jgi:hypothetical protein
MFRRLSIVGIAVLFGGHLAVAQVTTGTISGIVQDATGAAVAGAEIAIRNVETGISRNITSDPGGRYAAPDLPLGSYEVQAQHVGFQTEVRSGITLTVGREATVNLSLKVGQVSEKVTVTEEAPLVETSNANISYLVDEKKIADLPLNGRNYTQLATLQPGVIPIIGNLTRTDISAGHGIKMSIGGAQSNQNSFLLDGQDASDYAGQTPGSAAGTNLGIDAVREFTITANNYSTEYGLVAGGVMNVVTKSGTNAFHGSVFEYLRNSFFDAKNYFDPGNKPIPPFKRNQFGGIIGGPIKKDKIFFLGSYEGLRERLGLTYQSPVPNARAHQGYLPVNGVEQFIGVHPGVQAMMNLYPLPNGRDNSDGTGQFINNPTQPSDEDYTMGRIDAQLSNKDSLYGRYVFDQADVTRPGFLGIYGTTKHGRNQFFQLSSTHLASTSMVNEARAGVNRTFGNFGALYLKDVPVDQLSVVAGVHLASIWDITSPSIVTSDGVFIESPRRFTNTVYEFADNISYIKGKHSFKFGGILKDYFSNPQNNRNFMGTINFGSVQQFMQGIPTSIQGQRIDSQLSYQQWLMGWFAQYDVKVSARLTLTAGIRHEFTTAPSERYDRAHSMQTLFDSGPDLTKPLFTPSEDNFAPRVGLAWDVFGNGRTSLRAGAGAFQEQLVPVVLRYTYARMPNLTQDFTVTNPGVGVVRVDPTKLPPGSGSGLFYEPHPKLPTRYQWSLDVQHEVVGGTTVSVAYVGSRSNHLQYNPNNSDLYPPTCWPNCTSKSDFFFPAINPATAPRVNPNFASIQRHLWGGMAYYNSLQANVTRRFSKGLQYQGSYTFSRNIDTAGSTFGTVIALNSGNIPNPYNMRSERGLAGIDPRHQFSSNLTYDLPVARNSTGLVKGLIGGWQANMILTARGGLPFDIQSGYISSGLGRSRSGSGSPPGDRPDVAPGFSNNPTHGTTAGCQGVAAGQPLGTPTLYYDPCAFVLPAAGTFGNLGKNTLIGPGLFDLDYAMKKQFDITERTNLQFRAEFFNILNHPNFGNMIVTVFAGGAGARNGSAGQILNTATDARQMQFALRVSF